MLRTLLLAATLLACAIAAAAVLAGRHELTPLVFWSGLIALAVLLERWRYGRRTAAGEGPWEPTGERFVDPESGQAMQVLYNPRTGERRYEAAAETAP
jgi:hypothetical protein